MVEIKTDRAAWKKAVEDAADFAAKALAEQIRSDSLEYIPKQEGALRDNWERNPLEKGENPGEAVLVSNLIYSGYQWYGVRADGTHEVHDYTTPGTGKAWAEEARAANQENWDKVAQNAFTEGLK